MLQIRKFRAARAICQAGVLGTALVLLAGESSAQNPPAEGNFPASSPQAAASEPSVYLKFYHADWATVLNEVAEQSGSTLVMHAVPPGRFSRRDKEPYRRHEVVQILNRELEPEGFRILEKDQFLIVLHQRAVRTRYRRPERPSEPEWQPEPSNEPQFEPAQTYHRSVTPIATKEQQPPAPIRLVEDAQPVPMPAAAPEVRNQNQNTAPPAPASFAGELPAGWTSKKLTPQRKVRALAGAVYQALEQRAELVNEGVEGLPAFRVRLPAKAGAAGPEGFEVAIDVAKNELVYAAAPERVRLLTSLFQYLDRENNAFEKPIQLMAANEDTARLAGQLAPELNRISQEAHRPGAKPRPLPPARNVSGDLERDWALAQAQPPAGQQPPANAQPQPGGAQVVPVQPVQPGSPLNAIITNIQGDVQIQAIPELGIMILRGNQADVKALVEIIEQIQRQTAGAVPDVRLLLLKNLNSEALVELLRTVYEQLATIRSRTGQPRQQVSFIPIARPNAVMILAPQAEMESIQNLADELDRPTDPKASIEVFHLENAVASQAAAHLTSLYQTQAQPAPGTGAEAIAVGLRPRFQVVADVRTNALIVQARPNDLKEIAAVIRELDSGKSSAVSKMRIVPLKNAVADELANVITSAIQNVLNPPTVTGTPPQGQFNQQQLGQQGQGPQELRDAKSVVLDFLSVVGEQEQSVRSGILSDIRVTPDLRSNSLIVSAPEQSMDMMVALIERLDQPTSTVAEIKVFTLENADASSMIDLLTTLFQQDAGATQPGVQIVGAEDASSGLIPLRFSVDVRTNSIIAIGGGDALRVVEAILLRLDESDIRQRQTTVIKLRNSPALEVAAAINTFLQSQRDLAAIDPELVSNTELLEREIIAVAEPVSNSLLVSATPRYYEEIQKIIEKLDAEPPQVIIQALLVEVTLDNTDEFGVELGFQDDILFDRSTTLAEDLTTITTTNTTAGGNQFTSQQIISQATTPGFRFNDPTTGLGTNISAAPDILGSQSLSNFSLGRVNSDLGYGGLVLSASSNQVSMLLRALASRRQVHILSRPQIRTLDNQTAQIQVGQQVPVVDGVTFQGPNNAAFPIVRQDSAGIILTVTPRISPEENIVMEVIAEKSAFTGAGVPIFVDSATGNQITSPIKDITTARAVVGVPNGQTIVLGGMITKSDETIERKVPWLGDVPYLGLPFRYDSTQTRRTELLIFLTPRVIRGDADSELIKQVEAERMHFVEQEAEEVHGPLFSVPGPLSYPDWMQGDEFCPPMGGAPGAVIPHGEMPHGEIPVPAPYPNPAPAVSPPVPPAVPYDPSVPHSPGADQSMGLRDDSEVPTTIVPVGGYTQTSPRGGKQPPPAPQTNDEKKRPWYSLGG